MTTPTSAPSSSNTTTRWGRSGEPGSAFNGLSGRAGRGGRARGGTRGGRGGTRVTTSFHRDAKSEDKRNDKHPSNSQHPIPNQDKSLSSAPVPSAITYQSSNPAPPSKPKLPPTRASRATPLATSTQAQEVDAPSGPVSAKPSSKRRRSQAGKLSLTKISPPVPSDDLRSNNPRLTLPPYAAPIKDTPPHLNPKFGIRNDIDALVERVRAVAMDNNRPSTPGTHSHIDWAGDEDDGLPDLDDWGVTPSTFTSNKSDMISPLIVGGLKSLPDVTANTFSSSPPKQSSTIDEPQLEQDNSPTPIASIPPSGIEQANTTSAVKAQEPEERHQLSPSTSTNPSLPEQDTRKRMPLHPSLPAKPVGASLVSQVRSRPVATPMRNYPKSPIGTNTDDSDAKGTKFDLPSEISTSYDVPIEEVPETWISSDTPSATAIKLDEIFLQAPENATALGFRCAPLVPEVQSAKETSQHESQESVKNTKDEDWGRAGLSASIHAPKAISDSISAPATVSTYQDLPSDRILTHTRAHTVGRPPSFPKPSHNEYVPRFTRSGHSTPRSALQGQQHIRTQSTPPAGVTSTQQRAHRPIITGDAISRLARTIGKTSSVTNTKPQPVGSPGH